MAKKNDKNEKKPFIKTKTKSDNSKEVIVTKSPAKTGVGKIVVWLVCGFTVLVPLLGLILAIILLGK